MDNLQWFKFSPSDWMMGRIQRQPAQVQVDFIRLCCKYWQKDCALLSEDAQLEAIDSYDVLVRHRFITLDEDYIRISFLDEQYEFANAKRNKASEAGKRSAEVRKRSTDVQQTFNGGSTDAEQIRVDKSRVDTEEKRERKKSVAAPPPLLDEVIAYFKENGYTEDAARRAWNYYNASLVDGGRVWKDGKGQTVKSWKQKMQSVWFKDEYKIEQPREFHRPKDPTF